MDSFSVLGRWLLIVGIVIAVLGGILWLVGRIPGLQNLPGTIKVQGSGFTCVFPVLGSIILSIVLTIVLNLLLGFLRR